MVVWVLVIYIVWYTLHTSITSTYDKELKSKIPCPTHSIPIYRSAPLRLIHPCWCML